MGPRTRRESAQAVCVAACLLGLTSEGIAWWDQNMNNFLSVIAIIILPWVRISVFWEAALMCHGGSWGTQMLLDSSSLFSGSLNPVSWEGCAPLLKQLSATYALISWWVCISGLMRVALMTLPVWQDAAAARRDPRAARGVLWPSQRNPSCTEMWSVSSAQVPLSQKTNQGCCQPVSGPCNLFRIPVCAWDWVEVLLENVSHCGEKILGKMKKIHMTLCLVLLYFFTSTEKKKKIPGIVAEERQMKVFSPVHSKMKPDCELLKFPMEDKMLSFDCLASAGGRGQCLCRRPALPSAVRSRESQRLPRQGRPCGAPASLLSADPHPHSRSDAFTSFRWLICPIPPAPFLPYGLYIFLALDTCPEKRGQLWTS